MKIEDYDKYYQSGGSYLIPKEIFEELLEENKKYKEVIDKAIEWVRDWTDDKNDWFEEDSKPSELLEILKEGK